MAVPDSSFFLVNIGSQNADRFAKISPQDAELILRYRWRVTHTPIGHRRAYYATTRERGRMGRRIKMHRLILNAPDGVHVDHINGDGLDNRRENLRLVTPELNQANSRKHIVQTSRFKGVAWHKGANKWRAYIAINRGQQHLGLFDDELSAAAAYDAKALELWGEHAHLNLS